MASVRNNRMLILGLLCLLALPAGAWAQVKFTAEADQTEVSVGEPIHFKLIVESGGAPVDGSPVVANWGGLSLRGGPMPSHQMSVSIINGAQTMQDITSFEYELAATAQGKFTIPAAQIKVGGKTYQSQPVTISAGVHPVANLPTGLQGEQIISAKTESPDIDRQLEGRLFLRAVVSNKTPYVREPVIITYVLYNDGIALGNNFEMAPGDNQQGAVTDPLYQSNRFNWQMLQLGDRQYRVAQLFRMALTPTKTGKLAVNGLTVKLPIPVRRQRSNNPFPDPFDDPFFGGGGVQATLPSPPLELDVKPLPTQGQPAGFSNTVGDYAIKLEADRTQMTSDDLLTLKMTLDGKGAIDLVYPPEFPKGSDFQVVGQSNKSNDKKNTPEGIGGTRTFEIVLRPTRAGNLQVPALHYPIFNPAQGRYVDLATQPVPLKVAPGKTPVATGGPAPAQPESGSATAAPSENHLHYLHTLATLHTRQGAPLLESWTFWLLHLAAAGLVMGAWQHSRRLANLDPARVRRAGAWRNLERRIRFIRQQQGGSPQEVAGHLDHAARAYIADRFNLSADGLTRADVERLMLERAVPESRVRRLCDLLDRCEAMRYAPVGAVDGELGGWLDEIVTIFKENLRE